LGVIAGLVRPEDQRNFESDAALVGTAIHAAIEYEFTHGPQDRTTLDELALGRYAKCAADFRSDPNVDFGENTYSGNDSKAYTDIVDLIGKWFGSHIRAEYMQYDGVVSEWEFDVEFCKVDSVDVWLTGTADLLIPNVGVVDWKTAGRDYQRWEKQRWAVQPTVYTYAAHRSGYFDSTPVPFTFEVFARGRKGGVQTVDVWRDEGHWAWLARQITPMVRSIVAGGPKDFSELWQMNDQHALCSDKWCPFWSACKGEHMTGGWER
jgi:hypothetical protein